MKRTDIKITRFESGDYYVDIIETSEDFEAWLCEKTVDISELMFGVVKWATDFDSFCKLVVDSLDEYKKQYSEEYY